jgi:excisionase family DNA binding protein
MRKVSEVASRLNLSPSKIYELIETGKLGHYRIDGAIRISDDQIGAFLETARREPAAPRRSNLRTMLKHIRL